jgi:hypothetical protein
MPRINQIMLMGVKEEKYRLGGFSGGEKIFTLSDDNLWLTTNYPHIICLNTTLRAMKVKLSFRIPLFPAMAGTIIII